MTDSAVYRAACILIEVLVVSVMGVFLRFEDDSVESAKAAMQWNVKIISVCEHFMIGGCDGSTYF